MKKHNCKDSSECCCRNDCHDHHDCHDHAHHHDECGCGCGNDHEATDKRKEIIKYALGVIPIIIGFFGSIPFYIPLIAAVSAYVLFGIPVYVGMIRELRHGKVFTEFTLMCVATVGAFVIGEYADAAAVMYLYSLGETISSVAYARSKSSISQLLEITPNKANVLRDGEIIETEPDDVTVGETILVRAGERVPLDCVVTDGGAFADTSSVTGESSPLSLYEGVACPSGSLLSGGSVYMKVTKQYEESIAYRMTEAVEQAGKRRSTAEAKIRRFAALFTPIAFSVAVLVFVVGWMLSGDVAGWLRMAITVLVVSCPCSLVLSVPLAYFAGLGNAARQGMIFRGGEVIDRVAGLCSIVFDKTGTISEATLSYDSAEVFENTDKREFLSLAHAVLTHSPHAAAVSFCASYQCKNDVELLVDSVEIIGGRGVKCQVGGKQTLFGNGRLMRENGIEAPDTAFTAIYGAYDGKLLGRLDFSSKVKSGMKDAVRAMRELGIESLAVISGDAPEAVANACAEVGIEEYYGSCAPDEKLSVFDRIAKRDRKKGRSVAFCGDGLNDSAVIVAADVGIAMGKSGSALTVESADLILMDDAPQKIPVAVRIARKTSSVATSCIAISLGVKLAVVIASFALSFFGIQTPTALAVIADVGAAVLAVLNSLRALK